MLLMTELIAAGIVFVNVWLISSHFARTIANTDTTASHGFVIKRIAQARAIKIVLCSSMNRPIFSAIGATASSAGRRALAHRSARVSSDGARNSEMAAPIDNAVRSEE